MRLGPKKPAAHNGGSENNSQGYPNRAEEVRSRRAQRSKERINSLSSRVTNPPPSRPVIVRGGAFGRPIHQQATTRARRQFYVTMDRAAGTELRLPAIPMLHPGWRLASGFLAILMIFGISIMWNSPYCQIGTVSVKGLQRLSADEVNAVLNLENLAIIEVDPGQVKEKLTRTYPELINVHVRVDLPNAVAINAEERTPVLAVIEGEQTDWVDASGIIFPVRGKAGKLVTIHAKDGLPLVPVILDSKQLAQQEANIGENGSTTPSPQNTVTQLKKVDPTVLAALQELSKQLPSGTQLVYSKQHGLGWKSPEGWQIYIGTDLRDFEAKYSMYQQLTKYLADKGIAPAMVSIEHLNAPFYRLEQ